MPMDISAEIQYNKKTLCRRLMFSAFGAYSWSEPTEEVYG